MAVDVRRTAAGLQLDLTGEWGVGEVSAAQAQLAAIDLGGVREITVSTRGLTSLELSGAWVLWKFLQRARAAGVTVSFPEGTPDQLRLLDETLKTPDSGGGQRSASMACSSWLSRSQASRWSSCSCSLPISSSRASE